MAAPAAGSIPRYGFVLPEMTLIQPERVVHQQTHVNAPGNQPGALSHEQQLLAAYDLGERNRQRGGDNAMATDAHGKKDEGKSAPEWATKALVWAIVLIVLFLAGGLFFGKLDQLFNPGSSRQAEMQKLINDQNDRIKDLESGSGARVTGGSPRGAVTGGSIPRGAIAAGRVPSPEEIAGRVKHKVTRTPVPCIDGYEKNEATNQCDLVTWVPGPDPE